MFMQQIYISLSATKILFPSLNEGKNCKILLGILMQIYQILNGSLNEICCVFWIYI